MPLRKGQAAGGAQREPARESDPPRQPVLAAVAGATGGAAVLEPPAQAADTSQRPSRPAGAPVEMPQRWTGLPRRISVETAAYLVLGLLALLSRFFDLGSQALHHDESLHSYFSWLYYTGQGYHHDPLMHGPFLFHAAALVYYLFGDSNATSRYAPALFGAATVLLPWLLRRELGRWGALTASVLLLTSPSFLYFARFHRHDVYSAFFALLFFCAVVRFVAAPRPLWAFVGAAAWGFAFTNKEDIFIITAIFGAGLAVAILWQAAREVLYLGAAFVVFLGAVVKFVPKLLGWPALPQIPWDNPTGDAIRVYTSNLLTHPLVITIILLLVAFCVLASRLLTRLARGRGWVEGVFGGQPAGSPVAALHTYLADRRTLYISIGIAAGLYITLYTSLFSNLAGIFSGSFGALGYWLGQHDVRRAEQPWFYYLRVMPQYDPLAVFLGGFGVVLTGWRIVTHRLFGWTEGPQPFVRGLIAWWAVGSIAIYSWAGEKMPWMDIHPVLPLLLLAAALLGTAIECGVRSVERGLTKAEAESASAAAVRPNPQWSWAIGTVMLAAMLGWFLLAARRSYGGVADPRGWWVLLAPGLVIVALAVGFGVLRGWSRAGRVALLALAAGLLLFHVHAGWRLAYERGDVPLDMLVYVQTSPDVTRVMSDIDELSLLLTGGYNLPIMYDDNTSWPFQWYLRNYTQKQYFATTLTAPPSDDTAIVLVGNENLAAHPEIKDQLYNYVAQPYSMRWHFPENETYRQFAIAPELGPGWSVWMVQNQPHGLGDVVRSVVSSLTSTAKPNNQARLFRLLAYRDLGAPVGSYDFTVFIRKDLLPQYNAIRYK
ncbi:MAG: flippase activity-associated protein Agl23 [Thermomicrobiales bacterium]